MQNTGLITIWVWAVLLSLVGSAIAADGKRPNIVVFLADDLSVKDVSAYGNTVIPAPNIAALAKDGLTFDQAYATSPTCAPSRAALLTGCYNLRNGAMWNQQKPKAEIKKWPAYFKDLGYEVVAIGKVAHYAQVQGYGFDEVGYFNYHQDVCIDKAVEWLANRHADKSKADKPLCFLVGTNFPHVPWPAKGNLSPDQVELPAKNADTPETRQARTHYTAAVTRADSDLGLIRQAVRKYLPDDTVFVFSADQGAQWPFAKWNLYEAGLQVPLIVDWPGHTKPASRTGAMVSWIDLLPTLFDIAGGDSKVITSAIDGQSFSAVLEGNAQQHRDRVFATHSGDGDVNIYPSRSVRIGNWKYIRNLDPSLEFHTHIDRFSKDTGYWPSWVRRAAADPAIARIVDQYLHRPAEELYDLSVDPDEQKNLANDAAHAADLNRMRAAVDDWMKASHDTGLPTDQAIKPKPAKTTTKSGD